MLVGLLFVPTPPPLPSPRAPLPTPRCSQRQLEGGQWISSYQQGSQGTLVVRLVRNYACARDFTVDASRIGLRLQSVAVPARTRLLTPAERGILQEKPLKTGVLSWEPRKLGIDLTFHLPTDLTADMYAPIVMENAATYDPHTKRSPPLLPSIFPGQVYIPSGASGDPGLTQARRIFLNRTIYPRTGLGVACEAPQASGIFPSIPNDQPLRIIAISRSEKPGEIWTLGGTFKNTLDNAALFLSLDPLVVRFAAGNVRTSGGGGANVSVNRISSVLSNMLECGTMRMTISDPWEMERVLSFRHPYNRAEWPVRFRQAVKDHKVLPGMTHEMVASAIGYPSIYAPIAQLDRLERCDYINAAPFSASVIFKGDRVTVYNPPGELP